MGYRSNNRCKSGMGCDARSYYKMGSDWGNYGDHLNIEIEKNGSGSRLYITYSTPSQKRLESNDLQLLMKDIKQVAEGQLR